MDDAYNSECLCDVFKPQLRASLGRALCPLAPLAHISDQPPTTHF